MGKITASFNIYRTNRRIALQNMYIVLCIIGCLAFLSASVLYVSNTQVVAPLRRLIGVIQENASAVLGALRLDDADADGAKADSNGGGNTMLKLEETIAKLSKLAAHVTNVGDKGSNLLKEYMSNDTLDLETRHWIMGARPGSALRILQSRANRQRALHSKSVPRQAGCFAPGGVGTRATLLLVIFCLRCRDSQGN